MLTINQRQQLRQLSYVSRFPHRQAGYYYLPSAGSAPVGAAASNEREAINGLNDDQFASADDDPTAEVVNDMIRHNGQPTDISALIAANPYLGNPALASILAASSMMNKLHKGNSYMQQPWPNSAYFPKHQVEGHQEFSETIPKASLEQISRQAAMAEKAKRKLTTPTKDLQAKASKTLKGARSSSKRAGKDHQVDDIDEGHESHEVNMILSPQRKRAKRYSDEAAAMPPQFAENALSGFDEAFMGPIKSGSVQRAQPHSAKQRKSSTPSCPDSRNAPRHLLIQESAKSSQKPLSGLEGDNPSVHSKEDLVEGNRKQGTVLKNKNGLGMKAPSAKCTEQEVISDIHRDAAPEHRDESESVTKVSAKSPSRNTGSRVRLDPAFVEFKAKARSKQQLPSSQVARVAAAAASLSSRSSGVSEASSVHDSLASGDYDDDDDASTTSSMISSNKYGSGQRRKDVLWTQEEDDALTAGLEALFASDAWIRKHGDDDEDDGDGKAYNACISNEEWESIVENYLQGKRNVRQCRRRWARMKKLAQSKPPPKQGERWTAEEDETLRLAVMQEKHISPRFKWSWIARKYFKDTRSSEQCRTRWNVRVKHPDWTPADDGLILSMRDAGESWSEISKCFPSRPTVTVKRRWAKLDSDRKLSADPLWGGWTEEEMHQLVGALAKAGDIHWKEVDGLPYHIRHPDAHDSEHV